MVTGRTAFPERMLHHLRLQRDWEHQRCLPRVRHRDPAEGDELNDPVCGHIDLFAHIPHPALAARQR